MAKKQEESDGQTRRGGFRGGVQGTVTGTIISNDEERPFRIVAPGNAAESGTEEMIDRLLKEEYKSISKLVDVVLDVTKGNGNLIRKLTVEFDKKKSKSTGKDKTGVKRGRPKKTTPTPFLNFGIGSGSPDGETITPEPTQGGVNKPRSSLVTPLFYTGDDAGSERSNHALARTDKSGLFTDLDVSWFGLMLDAVNRLSDRIDDVYVLLNNRIPTMDDLRGVVSGAVGGSSVERKDNIVRAETRTEQEEERKETLDDDDEKEREKDARRNNRYREESWIEERLHELTGMAVNFAGLGELDDMLGITDKVWDKLGDLLGNLKNRKKNPKIEVLDPQEIMIPPKSMGEGEVIDVETVSDDFQDRFSSRGRHGMLELPPPVSWEFPEQGQIEGGTASEGSLGSISGVIGGDIIDITGESDVLQLQPPPKEALEITVPDDIRGALEGLKNAKFEDDDDLTKKDLLDVFKKQRVTRDIADMQQANFGSRVGSENDVLGGLGKEGLGDLKSLIKQMGSKNGGMGGMMSLLKAAPMLMLGKAALVGATAVGGYMLGNEIFDQVAGDKYEAKLMEDVDSNLTEKAKTDSGRDIAHTKGGYEESIRTLKLQNTELQKSGDPLSLRLIEKNNKLIESYRSRADELYSEGAVKKALEGGKTFEDIAGENRGIITRLEDELKSENVENRKAKEEQLKYELLLKRGLDKKSEEFAAGEQARAEEAAAQRKDETDAISASVSEGVTGSLTGIGGSLTGDNLVTKDDRLVTKGELEGLSAGASTIGLAAGGVGLGSFVPYPSPFMGGVSDQVQSFGMSGAYGQHPYRSVDSVQAVNRDVSFKELDGIPVGQYDQIEKSINGIPAGQYDQVARGIDGIPAINREQVAKSLDGVQAGNRPILGKNINGIPASQYGGYGLFGSSLQGHLGANIPGIGVGLNGIISDIGGRTGISGMLQGGVSDKINDKLRGSIGGMLHGSNLQDITSGNINVGGLLQAGLNGKINDNLRGSIGGMLQGSNLRDIASGNFNIGGMLQGVDTSILGDKMNGVLSGGISGQLSGSIREISKSLGNLNLIQDKVSGVVQESVSKGEIQDGTSDLVRENEERNNEVLDKIAQSAMAAGSLAGAGSTAGGGDTAGGGGKVSVSDARMGLDDVGIMLVNMGYFS